MFNITAVHKVECLRDTWFPCHLTLLQANATEGLIGAVFEI